MYWSQPLRANVFPLFVNNASADSNISTAWFTSSRASHNWPATKIATQAQIRTRFLIIGSTLRAAHRWLRWWIRATKLEHANTCGKHARRRKIDSRNQDLCDRLALAGDYFNYCIHIESHINVHVSWRNESSVNIKLKEVYLHQFTLRVNCQNFTWNFLPTSQAVWNLLYIN